MSLFSAVVFAMQNLKREIQRIKGEMSKRDSASNA